MKDVLQDLLSILNTVEVRGQDNLARLYNSIDIVKKLLSAVPESPQVAVDIQPEEKSIDGPIEIE